MRKMTKQAAAFLLAAILAVAGTGCGKQNKDDSGNAGGTNSSSEGRTSGSTSGTGTEGGGSQQDSQGGFDWLDTSGNLPIVKDGVEKTLKIACRMSVDSGNPEDMWFFQFIEDQMNINIDVDKFTDENYNEYLSLTFADNDLPDIIIGGALSATDLVTYGAVEGQILDLAPYINETFMPNLSGIYAEHPDYKSAVTDSEGHVWSLGYINDPTDRGQIARGFLNYDWLEEEGLKVPETLDEFIDMLRTFQSRGDNIIPMGGSYTSNNPCLIILNALGYNTNDAQGLAIGLRNGAVVLPVADREGYGEYLKVMNTIYTEGLIDPDFYTTDSTTSNAILSEDRVGYMAQAPFVFRPDFSAWWGAAPLTSDYNSTRFWPSSNSAVNAGYFVVSANCKEPELAAAFADWFFEPTGQNYELSTSGPAATQTDYLYGVKGFKIDPDTKAVTWTDVEENPNVYSSKNDFINKKVALWGFRTLGIGAASSTLVKEQMDGWTESELDDGYPDITGMEDPSSLRTSLTDGEMHFRLSLEDTLVPHVRIGYPGIVYLDQETALKAANLLTVIKEYATQESAKFVTGARSLEELDAYFTEIERLGALDYVKIYQDYYDSIQK